MAITVIEATKLDTFKNFRLVSGFSGLDNIMEKVGILDWEFFSKSEWMFIKGEFVLTSLLFAKDNPEYILEAVQELVKDGASGLAIKNIYYNEIPQEVVEYANRESFPIFIFDNSVYFEDIITDVKDKIRSVENYELLEMKIDILIKKRLEKNTVKEIAYEMNSSFKNNFFALYLKKKKYMGGNSIVSMLERIKKSRCIDLHSSALKYRNGILMILTDDVLVDSSISKCMDSLTACLDIDLSEYYAGVSNPHDTISELDLGISECIYAQRTGEVTDRTLHHFNEIGTYSILMPFADEVWMQNFYNKIIQPIKAYDEKYNAELFATASAYVQNDWNIIETAKALHLHKNTIRYRMGKIKELLHMENSEGSFYEQLSIAIRLHSIYSL